jgi:hypothetical protein
MSAEPTTTDPQPGDKRAFTFTPAGGEEPVTVTATYVTTVDGELEPAVSGGDASDILEAWAWADYDHRRYYWPTTEHDDDDVFFAYIDDHGGVVLGSWQIVTEADHYSLSVLPSLLPGHHYTLEPAAEPRP